MPPNQLVREKCVLVPEQLLWFFRALHVVQTCKASPRSYQWFFTGGLGQHTCVDVTLIALSVLRDLWARAPRPELAGAVPQAGCVTLDKAFGLSSFTPCFRCQGDASCTSDRCAQVTLLVIVTLRGSSMAFYICNYSSC